QRLVAWLVWFAASTLAATIRYRIRDPHGFITRQDFKQSIFCIWHNRLALCVKLYYTFGQKHDDTPGLAGLVSASKDGALLSAIFQRFGVQPVRGSSSRRGAQALVELNTWAERGYDLAITPDGPRGPRYVFADGAVTLAQITGLPLVPASYHLNWKIQVKSWDRFQIPLPFTRCDVQVGKVFKIPRELTEEQRVTFKQEVEAELRAITKD
ncbi:MAG TPA: lysophospholipid acyltransferase family protein, partial [Candidatus Binatia bacterium]|nr:lysophospholipid acyltransferase family protein [Candidatus Binatia bacterium]